MPVQEKTRKAWEGDVVELLEDYPKSDLRKGQRGVVIESFDSPHEAYDLSIEDGEGRLIGFAYSIKPEQFRNLSRQAFEEGMALLDEMKVDEAARALSRAIELQPSYIGILLNSLLKGFELVDSWPAKVYLLRFVTTIDPQYKIAKDNLAIAYLNWGTAIAKVDPTSNIAIRLFQKALTITSEAEIITQLHKNLAASFTAIGIESDREGNLSDSLNAVRIACSYHPAEYTQENFWKASIKWAVDCMERRDYQHAAAAFEDAWDAGFTHHETINDYGIALVFLGRLPEAKWAFERALKLSPENPVLLHNLHLITGKESVESFDYENFNFARERLNYNYPLIPLEVRPYQQVAA